MQTWNSIVGSNTQGGTLTWNGNGTLGQLQITDTYHTGNAQTCAFGYDDLSRLTTDQCGGVWQQTFGYDAFGNIEKTGSSTFLVGYTSGNHISGYSYDGDGNLTYDGTTHYNYDAEGRPTSITGGPTAVYDAFNRLVEVQSGGVTTNLVYSPDGYKFAFMNGSTVKRYSDAPAGGIAGGVHSGHPSGSCILETRRLAGFGAHGFHRQPWRLLRRSLRTLWRELCRDRDHRPQLYRQTQDITLGLYDFSFRQQSSAQGRWLVPDPAGLAAVDLTNPQTWNSYAYLANNPLNATDPLGLYCAISADGGTFRGCQQGAAGYGWGSGEFELMTLPVYEEDYTPAIPISTPFSAINNEFGTATSVRLYIPGGWSLFQVGTGMNFLNNPGMYLTGISGAGGSGKGDPQRTLPVVSTPMRFQLDRRINTAITLAAYTLC